jgi:dipeptide/tripeptide permease
MAAESQRHPKGLYVLFATEMWERARPSGG